MQLIEGHNIQTEQDTYVLADPSGKILAYFEESSDWTIHCMIDYCGNYWAELKAKSDPAIFCFTNNKNSVDAALNAIAEMDNSFIHEPIGDRVNS
jgi:hypothetical protein